MRALGRLVQFAALYAAGLCLLWAAKVALGLSDYLVPPPVELWSVARADGAAFTTAVSNTLGVAVLGHVLAVVLATAVGLVGRLASWPGALTRLAAYNLQAYPVVALAPLIFLFFGDGLLARLLITALVCYFPLLLSFIGIFSEPVEAVEHFYRATGRLDWRLEIRIRTFENLDKIVTVVVGSGTLAMVGTIIGEFLAAGRGIGYVIRKALYQGNLARILVALFLIGLASSLYLAAVEGVGTAWKRRLRGAGR
ncbi:ABC transporter permease [Dissulfurirhabdus thermomarina]|uniref:ABC transporter permease n=1 Tax=Dissulfurirhabdus thermomarina TaxID=1765737 RepID=A0A6N9TQG0_DISTH|nr:ABC transporter permease subunit [Dissulfurirhabdus thermomarina]NDY41964.1 ABC transporter permease [Dissulfurirhabdus thermomarina]NMX22813.1 ABC transporter permease [Dissulfurirhabdus thermomarina]